MASAKKYSISTSYNENSKIFKLPLHPQPLPSADEVVLGMIYEVSQLGIKVKILNYQKKEGYIALSELSKRRVYRITSELQVGDIVPLLVLRSGNGFVDLSNKNIDSIGEDVKRMEVYFRMCKLFQKWIITMNKKDVSPTDEKPSVVDLNIDDDEWTSVMRATLWKYGLGDTYMKAIRVISKSESLVNEFPDLQTYSATDLETLEKIFMDSIKFVTKINIHLALRCRGINALETIKNIITTVEKKLTDHNIKFTTDISAPTYDFMITEKNKEVVDLVYNDAIPFIKKMLEETPDIKYDLSWKKEDIQLPF
jgi:translation initiation factor 2 alpha subunit (eIF-2alpha)